MLSQTVFVFLLILPDDDSMHFIIFYTCEMSSIKNWFVLATRLTENLTQMVFCQPFAIQHVRTCCSFGTHVVA